MHYKIFVEIKNIRTHKNISTCVLNCGVNLKKFTSFVYNATCSLLSSNDNLIDNTCYVSYDANHIFDESKDTFFN